MKLSPAQLQKVIMKAQQIESLPYIFALREAEREYLRRACMQRWEPIWKPRVRVIRAQGKPLIVLRVGKYFCSAFTWDHLVRKVALGKWKRIADTTLEKRWR